MSTTTKERIIPPSSTPTDMGVQRFFLSPTTPATTYRFDLFAQFLSEWAQSIATALTATNNTAARGVVEGKARSATPKREAKPEINPVANRLTRLENRLGVSKVAMVEILQVSRPAYYGWFSGTSPRKANQAALTWLENFVDAVDQTYHGSLTRRFDQRLGPKKLQLHVLLTRRDAEPAMVAKWLMDADAVQSQRPVIGAWKSFRPGPVPGISGARLE